MFLKLISIVHHNYKLVCVDFNDDAVVMFALIKLLTRKPFFSVEEVPVLTLDISPEENNETKLDWKMVGESRNRPVGKYSLKVNEADSHKESPTVYPGNIKTVYLNPLKQNV